mmetsp:Transcript_54349/g.133214  ORF Transcript_54349/g.133214 Transcript_54349/m.133214 type:complete len:205 (+) Transcript_54349:298-912(+)
MGACVSAQPAGGAVLGKRQRVASPQKRVGPSMVFDGTPRADSDEATGVIVNNLPVTHGALVDLQLRGIGPMPPGQYWYDPVSGGWGFVGSGLVGILPPDLTFSGGVLDERCSRGVTGVFVNGRELHANDLVWLSSFGVELVRGRYWLQANGPFGVEGSSVAIGNLLDARDGELAATLSDAMDGSRLEDEALAQAGPATPSHLVN